MLIHTYVLSEMYPLTIDGLFQINQINEDIVKYI